MRLLDTSTLILRDFHDDEIPDYAILSHTWESGEVSYQAMESAASEVASAISEGLDEAARVNKWASFEPTTLMGYTKITKCCTLAASEGWQYLWVDTCCIDKTSSAELSEAINSMYRWYEEAQVCYVYMADVSRVLPQKFQWSRWFTRGWTLQELLAPSTVVFYDKDWLEIGTRWSLKERISRATGITYESMNRPKSCSIATKMSWASNRRTTRVEDVAYCLMGLFEINMPLLYGEGSKAFMRLQHEIAESEQHDESIFAWRDAGLVSSGMFARSPEAFADSGDICSVRNPNPRAQPFRVTRTSIFLDIPIPKRDVKKGSFRLTLSCAFAGSQSTYLAVELELSPSGNYVRSSPGDLIECKFFRGLEMTSPGQSVNTTLQMSLNYGDYRATKDASIKRQRIVVLPSTSIFPVDSFYLERVHQSDVTYIQPLWLVPDPSLSGQKDSSSGLTRLLPNGFRTIDPYHPLSGTRMYKIDLEHGQPVAVMIFPINGFRKTTDHYAIMLTISDNTPKLAVVPLPNLLDSFRDTVKLFLENPPPDAREMRGDQFFISESENVRSKVQITMRKRVIENSKVHCVKVEHIRS